MAITERRLQRLEQRYPHCSVCESWHEIKPIRTITTSEAEALEEPEGSVPVLCPNCDRPTPNRINMIIVRIDEEEPTCSATRA